MNATPGARLSKVVASPAALVDNTSDRRTVALVVASCCCIPLPVDFGMDAFRVRVRVRVIIVDQRGNNYCAI